MIPMTRLSVLALAAWTLAAAPPARAGQTKIPEQRSASHRKHAAEMESARPKKTRVDQPVAVDMKLVTNHPTVQVMFGDKGPFTFIVDSGAGSTVINSDLAEELGLEVVGKTRIGDPMNPEAIEANVVRIPSLSIGGATFEDFRAASWAHQELRKGENAPRGVIGFPTFTDVLLTFDYVDQKLRIAPGDLPEPDGKTVLAYVAPMGIPEFTLKLGGVDVVTHLDTGSGGFYSVPKRYQDKLKFSGPLTEVGRGRTVNTEMILRGAELDGTLAFGQFAWEKPFIIVSDELPLGNLGTRALASFAVTFDQRRKAMRFEQKAPLVAERPKAMGGGPVAANAAAGPPASGMRFASHGEGDLEVYSVEPGSPGEKAGIVAGEKVLEVNGVALAAMGDGLRAAMRTSPLKLKLEKDGKTREVVVTF
jgi:predicted aspartyl protease